MKLFSKMIVATSAAILAACVQAGDPALGKNKTAVCTACHGANGIATIKTYPSLAGQNELYLVSAMKAYKNKKRTGGLASVMQAQMASLSEEDMSNIAAYYASLKAK